VRSLENAAEDPVESGHSHRRLMASRRAQVFTKVYNPAALTEEHEMKSLAFSAVALALTASMFAPAKSSEKSGGTDAKVEQTIRSLADQGRDAALKGDSSWVEKNTATEYVRIMPDGSVLGRQQAIDLLKSGSVKYSAIEVSEQQFHQYGDTVIETLKASVKGTRDGNSLDGDYRGTRIWVKQGGQWKVAAYHTSKIGNM
jgi:hypothetical protein